MMRRTCGLVLAAVLWLAPGVDRAFAETQSVIDPIEAPGAPKPPASATIKPAQPDAASRRERQRAAEEQRKRAKAEARALAAETEAAKLRASERARHAEAAARDAATRAAARKAAAARAAAARAAAAKMTRARIAAEKEAAQKEAVASEVAAREAAAREAAARETAAREATERETAAREAAAREAAAQAAARDAAAREAAVRETAAQLALAREAATRELRASRAQPRFGTAFRDCADCPELMWLPQGEFMMGEPSAAIGPRHVVTIGYPLAVGRFEVTFAEWDACVAAGGCRRRPHHSGWGRGRQPVINVSWADAQQYALWLSRRTGKRYRLLTEAEWEYAARAGTDVRYWWGNDARQGEANCNDCGSPWDGRQAAPVGRFPPNPFGLHDMHGNVFEWVEDCYHYGYRDAPSDGSAWTHDCTASIDTRMLRGGAWHGPSMTTRSAARSTAASSHYDNRVGFRIARTE